MEVRSSRVEILLVEDDPGDVRLFREALSERYPNVHLQVVSDGEAAMRTLRRQEPFVSTKRPDLIILDLNLPRVDGREVLAAIKGDPELRSIPTVVLTTSNSDADIQQAYELHANCYIRKPNDLHQFLRFVAVCYEFWGAVVTLPPQS